MTLVYKDSQNLCNIRYISKLIYHDNISLIDESEKNFNKHRHTSYITYVDIWNCRNISNYMTYI